MPLPNLIKIIQQFKTNWRGWTDKECNCIRLSAFENWSSRNLVISNSVHFYSSLCNCAIQQANMKLVHTALTFIYVEGFAITPYYV